MKRIFYVFVTVLLSLSNSFANPNYQMRLADVKKVTDSKIEFDVYIKSKDSSFELSSYQCALVYNNNVSSSLKFSYENGSAELGISPSIGIGVNNADGKTKLTFASMPGSENINSSEHKVGHFILESNTPFNSGTDPDIQWSFDGNITTILTGANFDNITNWKNHTFQLKGQLPITHISASSTVSPGSTDYLTDGKVLSDGDFSSIWKTDKMPAYLIFDLGETQVVSETKFSFNNWDKGRIYQYSIFTSDDTTNWNEAVSNASSSSTEWTENTFDNISARYVKLLITGQNQNEWATLWEAQIWGAHETTDIKDDKQPIAAPQDFELMQNYPNPFNPSTKIRFNLSDQGKVNLDVYNMLGQKVASLLNEDMTKGIHEVEFSAKDGTGGALASGVYIYRLNVENKFSAMKKMILLK